MQAATNVPSSEGGKRTVPMNTGDRSSTQEGDADIFALVIRNVPVTIFVAASEILCTKGGMTFRIVGESRNGKSVHLVADYKSFDAAVEKQFVGSVAQSAEQRPSSQEASSGNT